MPCLACCKGLDDNKDAGCEFQLHNGAVLVLKEASELKQALPAVYNATIDQQMHARTMVFLFVSRRRVERRVSVPWGLFCVDVAHCIYRDIGQRSRGRACVEAV